MKELQVLNKYESENLNITRLLWDIKSNPYSLVDRDVATQCRLLLEEIESCGYSEYDDEVVELFDSYLDKQGYTSLRNFFNTNIDLKMVDIVLVDRKDKIVDYYTTNNYSKVLLNYIDKDNNFGLREELEINLELSEDDDLYEVLNKKGAYDLDELCYDHYSNRGLRFKALLFDYVLCDFDFDYFGNIFSIYICDIINRYCR